jgi:hypothetical protein
MEVAEMGGTYLGKSDSFKAWEKSQGRNPNDTYQADPFSDWINSSKWEKEQEAAAAKGAAGTLTTGDISGLPKAPDATDAAVQAKKMQAALAIMSGRGRKQSFLGGAYDNSSLGGGSILGGL